MGTRYRKSVKAGPLRVNLSKSGVGYSVGTKGFRYTKKAGGGTRTTASIPGTGISYVKETGKRKTGSTTSLHNQGSVSTHTNNNGQRKAARILCIIAAIPICLFAVFGLLCGEYLISAIFGVIGILFLAAAKKLKNTPSDPRIQSFDDKQIPPTTTYSATHKPIMDAGQKASATFAERTYRVAGTSFRVESIMNLAEENLAYDYSKKELIDDCMVNERVWQYDFDPTDVKLVPEPGNPEDPNAIKVIVDGEHIGYIKAGSCAHIQKLLKGNRILSISCEITGGPYKYISEDYDEDKDKDVYVLQRGNANFSASLTIRESIE